MQRAIRRLIPAAWALPPATSEVEREDSARFFWCSHLSEVPAKTDPSPGAGSAEKRRAACLYGLASDDAAIQLCPPRLGLPASPAFAMLE
jgi:hypothetical protein